MNNKERYEPLAALHLHSSIGSQLDGCGLISSYIKKAKEFEHKGFALTDHGNMTGIYEHHRQLKAAGLKPIAGCEFYFTTNLDNKIPSRKRPLEERDKHQTVLIKNKEGYGNACKLNYWSFTKGFYYKPRINYEMLFEQKGGLIVTSGCMVSMFNQLITNDRYEQAEEWFKKFVEEFGEDFYGEIQFNEITDKNKYGISQKDCNDFILDMCKKYSIKHIIGGDIHYAEPEDTKLQDIVINVSNRRDEKSIKENNESFIHARHLYYHSSKDYYNFNEKFGYSYNESVINQSFKNSIEILDKIDFEFETGKINFPKFVHPTIKDKTNSEILKELAEDGLVKKIQERKQRGEKFPKAKIDEYIKRLEYELKIIEEKQIVDYFLIVQDVLDWARKQGFRTGISRGSVGGSLLAYSVNITGVDPIKFNLLFERFQNPSRVSLPDVDCLCEDCEILMANGLFKTVQNIVVGDSVQGIEGAEEVVGVQKRKLKTKERVYQIETEDGSVIKLTENHKMFVMRNNKQEIIYVKDVLETDNLLLF